MAAPAWFAFVDSILRVGVNTRTTTVHETWLFDTCFNIYSLPLHMEESVLAMLMVLGSSSVLPILTNTPHPKPKPLTLNRLNPQP
jgi:hypothetical protein